MAGTTVTAGTVATARCLHVAITATARLQRATVRRGVAVVRAGAVVTVRGAIRIIRGALADADARPAVATIKRQDLPWIKKRRLVRRFLVFVGKIAIYRNMW